MKEQQEKQRPFGDAKAGFNLLILLISGVAATLHLFVRSPGTCGKRYFGVQAGLGWLFAGLYPSLWPNTPGLMAQYAFFLLMIPMLAIHHSALRGRIRKGQRPHSYAVGRSIFQFREGEAAFKRAKAMESFFCIAGGFCLCAVSPSLGSYLMLGAFASAIQESMIEERDRRRVDAMEDAMIDQEYYAQLLKQRLEDRS